MTGLGLKYLIADIYSTSVILGSCGTFFISTWCLHCIPSARLAIRKGLRTSRALSPCSLGSSLYPRCLKRCHSHLHAGCCSRDLTAAVACAARSKTTSLEDCRAIYNRSLGVFSCFGHQSSDNTAHVTQTDRAREAANFTSSDCKRRLRR